MSATDATVTIYTTGPDCMACRMTKKQLDKRGIAYDEVPLEGNPSAQDLVRGMGYTQAPVVLTGDRSWSGFRLDQIKAIVRNR